MQCEAPRKQAAQETISPSSIKEQLGRVVALDGILAAHGLGGELMHGSISRLRTDFLIAYSDWEKGGKKNSGAAHEKLAELAEIIDSWEGACKLECLNEITRLKNTLDSMRHFDKLQTNLNYLDKGAIRFSVELEVVGMALNREYSRIYSGSVSGEELVESIKDALRDKREIDQISAKHNSMKAQIAEEAGKQIHGAIIAHEILRPMVQMGEDRALKELLGLAREYTAVREKWEKSGMADDSCMLDMMRLAGQAKKLAYVAEKEMKEAIDSFRAMLDRIQSMQKKGVRLESYDSYVQEVAAEFRAAYAEWKSPSEIPGVFEAAFQTIVRIVKQERSGIIAAYSAYKGAAAEMPGMEFEQKPVKQLTRKELIKELKEMNSEEPDIMTADELERYVQLFECANAELRAHRLSLTFSKELKELEKEMKRAANNAGREWISRKFRDFVELET